MPKPNQFALCVDATVNALVEKAPKFGIATADAEVAAGHMINLATRYGGKKKFEVAVQGGSLAFVRAMHKFDPSRGVPFTAFAKKRLLGGVTRALRADRYGISEEDEDEDVEAMAEMIESTEPSPVNVAIDNEVLGKIENMVARLPDDLRPVAQGVILDDRSRAEVSRHTGVSRTTITNRMHRISIIAVVQLKSVFDDAIAA